MQTQIHKFRFILAVIVILPILFGWRVTPASANTGEELLQDDEEKIRAVIDAYFTIRYEARISQTEADFSSVTLASEPKYQAWLQHEREHEQLQLYQDRASNTEYLKYEFSLDYQAIEINGDNAVVKLLEGNWIYRTNRPSLPSGMANREHTIILKKVDKQWLIVSDQYYDDIMKALDSASMEELQENIIKNSKPVSDAFINEDKPVPEQPLSLRSTYNGASTLAYTAIWWNGINPTYDDAGLDCTNFASQAIYEGTYQTMSDGRDYFVDWYYDFYDHSGSVPWISVGPFFTFLTTNTGKGPYGYATSDHLCALYPGDVITMKAGTSWQHTVVVRSLVECHDPAQVYVDAHDEDHYSRSLSEYSMFSWEGIHIQGYNP